MKCLVTIPALWTRLLACRRVPARLLLFIVALTLPAEIIDRIAASVDTLVITQSDVERHIRVTAFQDGTKPDLSTEHKKATVQLLIDQRLIQRDLESSHYPLPDPATLVPAIEQFQKDHFPSQAEYQKSLANYGITDQQFRDLLHWQETLLSFIEVRFASGVQVTPQEIADYFEKTVKPAAEAAHPGQPVELEDYRAQIEKKLADDRADRQLETWLASTRRRSQILIHEEALR